MDNILVEPNFIGEYVAYESDCDRDGNFITDVVGYGKTPLDAIVDLLDKKEDQ